VPSVDVGRLRTAQGRPRGFGRYSPGMRPDQQRNDAEVLVDRAGALGKPWRPGTITGRDCLILPLAIQAPYSAVEPL